MPTTRCEEGVSYTRVEGFSDGYVSELYKKGTRDDPRNYRPITLLHGDCKILTRILAKRMLNIVTKFVSDD